MTKSLLSIALILIFFNSIAQTDLKSTATMLQECLSLNSQEQPAVISLYENSGMIEYKQTFIIQRIKLADLHSIKVNSNVSGYSVDMNCFEENLCINFIKGDTSNSSLKGTAIQFNDVVLANTFAENLSKLVIHYKTNEPPLVKTLFKNADGNTPILSTKKIVQTTEQIENNKQKANEEKEEIEKEEIEKAPVEKRPNARSKRAEKKEVEEEKEEKEEKEVIKKTSKKTTKKEVSEEADEVKEKISAREKRRAARNATDESDEEKSEAENAPSEKKKVNRNKFIEDVNEDPTDVAKSKGGNDFCNQLLAILQSGKDNKFKSIEGKLTNVDTKINESSVKLKGARKNYLSWYKKERAFIAELKSGNDYELVLKDYENMQTQLDECLGAGWDMEDKSGSDEYVKLKTEVKDVEFKKESDATMPTIRVIFLEDNNKFTMFMRVK